MTWLIVLGCVLAFLVLLLLLPIAAFIEVDEHFTLKLKIALFQKDLVSPTPQKPKSLKPRAFKKKMASLEPKEKTPKEPKKKKKEKKKDKLSFQTIQELIRAGMEILSKLLPKLFKQIHIDIHQCHLSIGLEDAADTAMATGGAISAAQLGIELMDHYMVLSPESPNNIHIEPDYLNNRFSCSIRLTVMIRLFGIFSVIFSAIHMLIKHRRLLFKLL